jgi:hypothetical protein
MGAITKLVVGLIFISLVFTGLSAFLGESIVKYDLDSNENVTNVYLAFQNVSSSEEITDIQDDLQNGSDSWVDGTFLEGVWYSWQDTSFYKIGSAVRTASNTYKTSGEMIEASSASFGIDSRFVNGFRVAATIAILLIIAGILFKRNI